jgi:hypothetical protein
MGIIGCEHKDCSEQKGAENCGHKTIPKGYVIGDERRNERESRKQRNVTQINRGPIYGHTLKLLDVISGQIIGPLSHTALRGGGTKLRWHRFPDSVAVSQLHPLTMQ